MAKNQLFCSKIRNGGNLKMTKSEIKEVVRDFIAGVEPDITLDNLFDTMGGCAYWTEKKHITKEMLIKHLRYQCYYLDGSINNEALSESCEIFKTKIIMI